MALNLVPPPTYAPLTVPNSKGAQSAINPVWLEWFIQYGSQTNYTNSITPSNTQWSEASSGTVNTNFDFSNNTTTPLAVFISTPNPSSLTFVSSYTTGGTVHVINQVLPTTCVFMVLYPGDIIKIGATSGYASSLIYRPL